VICRNVAHAILFILNIVIAEQTKEAAYLNGRANPDAYHRGCRTLNFLFSARCAALTKVERHTQINKVDKISSNLAIRSLLLAAMFGGLALPARAQAPASGCNINLDQVRLANPLSHVAKKLVNFEPITIVAIGSSSTWGAGASSPAANYPNRLAVELKRLFPTHSITIVNRGVGGEEVGDMLKRFDKVVVAAKPDLVLWQLGTNSVIRDHMFTDHGAAIRDGLNKIRAAGADIVLIDPQFAPKVIVKAEATHMVELIATTAKAENVDLFRRFDVMKHWREVDHLGFETFVSPDGLHMNDWSYACMAKGLGLAIADAAERPAVSATAMSHLVP
jgi:acyl-CoA thioesterase-1